MVTSLFIGNLHGGIDLPSIRNYFSRAGNIEDIYIPRNQKSQKRVYGFVRFNSQDEARKVIKRCNGDYVWGREIIVRQAARERRDALAFKSSFEPHQPGHYIQPHQPGQYFQPTNHSTQQWNQK